MSWTFDSFKTDELYTTNIINDRADNHTEKKTLTHHEFGAIWTLLDFPPFK